MPESSREGESAGQRKKLVRKSKAERRREIIEATVQLMTKYGVQGTTVARIASAVGLTKGALYQHFPNREAVLAEALAAMDEKSSAWIARASGPDVPARLLDMADAHSAWSLSEYNTFVRPFFQLIASNRETKLTDLIMERQRRDFRYLVDRIDEGKREGTIAADVESEDVAWSLFLHAWGEDIARLMGADEFITDGASRRIMRRLMASFTEASPT